LDTGCGNDSRNNTAIKREVKEEIITDENHVHSENNEEQRFVLIFCNSIKIICMSIIKVTTP
jgi:hypothetical protein